MHGRRVKILKMVSLYILLFLISIIWMVPIFTLISTALRSKTDFFNNFSLFSIPPRIAWENITNAVTKGRLLTYMKNGLFICMMKIPLGILVEALAAFALTRLAVKHKTGIFVFFLIGMMLPMQVALVPINIAYSKLNLTNTYLGLFYAYIGFGLSFGILVFRGFFRSIPKDIDEASYIDGCSKWRLFWNIILPISKPAIATLVITDFLATWNEYLLASVIITDNTKKTVPVGIMTFVGEHWTDYGYLCAGVLVSIIPVIVVYLMFQRYFVEGVAGAVKS